MASSKLKANRSKLRMIRAAQAELNNLSIVHSYHTAKDKNTSLYSHGKPINMARSIQFALENIRTKWDISVGVFCRTGRKHYALFTEIRASQECLSNDLSDLVQELCGQFYDEAPKDEKLCPFWVATPRSNDGVNNLELALKTAHRFKIFDELATNYEIEHKVEPVDYHKGDYNDIAATFEWKHVDLEIEAA